MLTIERQNVRKAGDRQSALADEATAAMDTPANRAQGLVELADTLPEGERLAILRDRIVAARAILGNITRSRPLANRMRVRDRVPALREAPAAAREVIDDKLRAQIGIFVSDLEDLVRLLGEILGRQEGFGGSKTPYHSDTIVPDGLVDLGIALQHVARNLGRPVATVRAQLGVEPAASATTKHRAKAARKGDDLNLSPSQIVAALEMEAVERGDSILFGLIRQYRKDRETVPLPPSGYTRLKDARAAARLSTTYGTVQARLKVAGMRPLPPDPSVTEARRLSSNFYQKTRGTRRRSRPAARATSPRP